MDTTRGSPFLQAAKVIQSLNLLHFAHGLTVYAVALMCTGAPA